MLSTEKLKKEDRRGKMREKGMNKKEENVCGKRKIIRKEEYHRKNKEIRMKVQEIRVKAQELFGVLGRSCGIIVVSVLLHILLRMPSFYTCF